MTTVVWNDIKTIYLAERHYERRGVKEGTIHLANPLVEMCDTIPPITAPLCDADSLLVVSESPEGVTCPQCRAIILTCMKVRVKFD